MLDKNEIYVVVDIEADGPVPGLYSMLSIAAVATDSKKDIADFYRTLQPIEGATQDADTMDWWKGQPEAWEEVVANPEQPDRVMESFVAWVKDLNAVPIFVAHPVALDYTFVSWYMHKFAKENPFRDNNNVTRTLDLRSFVAGRYALTLTQAHRKNLPSKLTDGMPHHSHKAIDDARGYALMLRNILAAEDIRSA